jgi:hypothetical protein
VNKGRVNIKTKLSFVVSPCVGLIKAAAAATITRRSTEGVTDFKSLIFVYNLAPSGQYCCRRGKGFPITLVPSGIKNRVNPSSYHKHKEAVPAPFPLCKEIEEGYKERHDSAMASPLPSLDLLIPIPHQPTTPYLRIRYDPNFSASKL